MKRPSVWIRSASSTPSSCTSVPERGSAGAPAAGSAATAVASSAVHDSRPTPAGPALPARAGGSARRLVSSPGCDAASAPPPCAGAAAGSVSLPPQAARPRHSATAVPSHRAGDSIDLMAGSPSAWPSTAVTCAWDNIPHSTLPSNSSMSARRQLPAMAHDQPAHPGAGPRAARAAAAGAPAAAQRRHLHGASRPRSSACSWTPRGRNWPAAAWRRPTARCRCCPACTGATCAASRAAPQPAPRRPPPAPLGLAAQVVARWMNDPDFLDAHGASRAAARSPAAPAPSTPWWPASAATCGPRPCSTNCSAWAWCTTPKPASCSKAAASRRARASRRCRGCSRSNLHDHAAAAVANLQGEGNFLEQAVFVDETHRGLGRAAARSVGAGLEGRPSRP